MTKAQPKHVRADEFNPVPHTNDDTARLLSKPAVKAAYDALGGEYSALREILLARRDAGLTQVKIAKRCDRDNEV
ncbi:MULTISPECIES: hypothetical protein [Paraburkholderia]|uniref:hypothetical protein n=1 Tax=Paraburkholderia TaxID=1822464 RepID=UPI00225479BB|nr:MULTISPECIES: hypothetical protein [Paraburkholderia]MCX4164806.1 hypothetical protein [Paraburkholderia megapolitana]MDN7160299.1 hypothetical protein [Paraburkholderia sp. CHISQ3]MDQ6497346.1 hypothetical protein [Paraburkholderia megapolitana]